MTKEWWYASGETQHGPIAIEALRQLFLTSKISERTLIWRRGLQDWTPLCRIPELHQFAGDIPPEIPTPRAHHPAMTRPQEAPQAPPSSREPAATVAATPEKKSGSWVWFWTVVVTTIVIKFFGAVPGVVAIGSYFWLKPKLGTWGALATSALIGVAVAFGLWVLIHR